MKIYLSVFLALAIVHVVLGRAQSPKNGSIPTALEAQHKIERAVHTVLKTVSSIIDSLNTNETTELEKSMLPVLPRLTAALLPPLVVALYEKNSTGVAPNKSHQHHATAAAMVSKALDVNKSLHVNNRTKGIEKRSLPVTPMLTARLIPLLVKAVFPNVSKEVANNKSHQNIERFEMDVSMAIRNTFDVHNHTNNTFGAHNHTNNTFGVHNHTNNTFGVHNHTKNRNHSTVEMEKRFLFFPVAMVAGLVARLIPIAEKELMLVIREVVPVVVKGADQATNVAKAAVKHVVKDPINVAKKAGKDVAKEVGKEVSKEIKEDAKDAVKEVAKDAVKEIAKGTTKNILEDMKHKVPRNVSQGVTTTPSSNRNSSTSKTNLH